MNFQHDQYYVMAEGDFTWVWQHDYMIGTTVWDKGVMFFEQGLPRRGASEGQPICLVDLRDEPSSVTFREATPKEIRILTWWTT